jgi:PIN domain nuclease of toxin-antitoxin system
MMGRSNLLLDTHILLWWLAESDHLPEFARRVIKDAHEVCVSAVTAWEIGMKTAAKKLEFNHDLEEQLLINAFRPLPISLAHATTAAHLPLIHKDPFDRLLVAQAMCESLTLLTVDSRIRAYNVPTLLARRD